LDKLTEADVQFKRIKPGFLNLKRGTAIFPIVGGGVDFDNLIVELFHTGGLSLDSQDGISVDLFNFVISNIIDFGFFPPSITGLTAIDGIIEARDVLFELAFTEENVKVKYNTLVISEVQITLNFFQAFNLNQLLGTNFEAGESVGTARVYARFHKEREHRYWKH
jgi:hypothetical protein